MEIDPALQLGLLLSSFLGGLALGLFYEALCVFRIPFGAFSPPSFMKERYARPLPIIKKAVPFGNASAPRRVWRALIIGVGDCLFSILFAVVVILLLYYYNDGAWRTSALFAALGGFALFQALSARLLRVAVAYFAYFFAAACLYFISLLKLPFKLCRLVAIRLVLRPVRTVFIRLVGIRAQRVSELLMREQLLLANTGFQQKKPSNGAKKVKKKGNSHHGKKTLSSAKNKDDVDHSHFDTDHIRGRTRHWREATDRMESAAQARR